ncbi:MAG: radical SAM protein [Candidatus Nanoarchaeia archaeon]|nr:B12-binding domain-containing radical SAM protein [Candidatus Jingweiarchaeum tengchongense]
MRVLLVRHHDIGNINTRLPESVNKVQGIYPPLGLLYIASSLRIAGYEVKFIDSQALNLTTQELKREIKKFDPNVIATMAMTSTLKGALEVCKLAKEVSKEIKTVIGGPHMYIFPKETVSYDFVDFGVSGEGEFRIIELLEFLKGKKKIQHIDGLTYEKRKKIHHIPVKRYIKDINLIPFPSRDIIQINKYYSIISLHPFTTMITSRGCPFNCSYCFKSPIDRYIRFRSKENTIAEIEQCLNNFKLKEIWFYDDTFTLNRKHVEGICNEIIARNIKFKWEAPTRVDTIDFKLLKLMKKAGCLRLRLGIESGNSRILKLMKKGINKRQIEKAIKMCKKVGIETFCFFMLGYPTETEKEMKKTIDFAIKLNPDWAMFSITTPYPETELYKFAGELGLVDSDYWRSFTLNKANERMPYCAKNVEHYTKIAYRKFYFRPRFIINLLLNTKDISQFKKYFDGFLALTKFKIIPV